MHSVEDMGDSAEGGLAGFGDDMPDVGRHRNPFEGLMASFLRCQTCDKKVDVLFFFLVTYGQFPSVSVC